MEEKLYKKIMFLLDSINFKELCDTVYKLYDVSKDKEKIAVIVKLLNYMHHVDDKGQDIISENDSKNIDREFSEEISLIDYIEYYSYIGNFALAIKSIESYKRSGNVLNSYYLILNSLNRINRRKNLNLYKYLWSFASKKDIESISTILKEEAKKRELPAKCYALIKICDDYSMVREKGIIPKVRYTQDEDCDLFDLIDNKDYKRAKKLMEDTSRRYNDDIMYLILNMLVNAIERVEVEEILSVKDEVLFKLRCIMNFPSSNEFNIDDVAKDFEFNEEEKMLYTLVVAEECYRNHNVLVADRLVKLVEKNKNKTTLVRYYLDEVRKGKKLQLNKIYTHTMN